MLLETTNNKIKLLLVTSVFVDRGVERIIILLHNHLPKDIYEIRILCLRTLSPYADYLNKNTDIKVDVIGMKNNIDIAALFRFYKYFRRFKPDIVNFHSFRAALWGRVLARLAKVPCVLYSVHNKWGGAVHRFLDKSMSRFTDAIVPFSLAVRKFIVDEENIHEKYVTDPIYIGIDIDKFSKVNKDAINELRKKLKINEDQNILGFIGSISEQKGLAYLVEAVKGLKPSFPGICCLIIGDGPEAPALRKLIAGYKLEENFRFLGQRYDTPDLLTLMDIFILPSLWEGLPQVVLEAMAASCPVIATHVDGTPEIITHMKDGWLIPPANVNELTGAIKTMLNDDKLRTAISKNGFSTVSDKFNIKTMVDNYNNLYQHYLNKTS